MASLYPDRYLRALKLLVAARKAAGITQVELAAKLRQRQTFVSKVETGERRLDPVEFIAISEAIGADPFEILRRVK